MKKSATTKKREASGTTGNNQTNDGDDAAAVAAAGKEGGATTAVSRLEKDLEMLAIKATSQESRFHTESISTSSKEIDLKDVNLFVGARQLLQDAHLRLKEGIHYGLVGRNGTGKSSE
jgi:ABC-type molybdenum transport system ATPase subunit/photorepair protein PhrA